MIIPIRKHTPIKTGSFLVFIMEEPTPSPRGVMAVSAPSWKKAMPMISINAQKKNRAIVTVSKETTKIESRSTITLIGRTAFTDSSNFSLSFLFKMASHYFLF